MIFKDRADAGRQLAAAVLERLREEARGGKVIVLAIPRGGVVVGFELARALGAPLDLWFSRKIGAPGNPEFAIGSVAETGPAEIDARIAGALGVSPAYIAAEVVKQRAEIARRALAYRGPAAGAAAAPSLENKTVLLVDDGIATGSTVRSALKSLRSLRPARVILAIPVAPPDTLARLRGDADEIVALHVPPDFGAVGQFYEDFGQTSDEEVVALMNRSKTPGGE